LSIRGPREGARAVRVRDVLTPHDQQWLCRGDDGDVRIALEASRLTIQISDCDHPGATIDLTNGAITAPKDDHCPAALLVTPIADDGLPRSRSDADVEVLDSQTLLDLATARVLPEYPNLAAMARISGRAGVQVTVGTDGKVESASIVKPLPFGIAESMHAAVLQWEFTPQASRVSGVIAFRFEILRTRIGVPSMR
jgi:TonB family protein